MGEQSERPLTTTWAYKLLVIMVMPFLYAYYIILQPLTIYFKKLIAEQNGSIRHHETTIKSSESTAIRKAFVKQSTNVLAATLTLWLYRYRWYMLALLVACMALILGIIPTVESIILWIVAWICYTAVASFLRGINQ